MYWSENIIPGMFVSNLKSKIGYVILINKNIRKVLNYFLKTRVKGMYAAKHTI